MVPGRTEAAIRCFEAVAVETWETCFRCPTAGREWAWRCCAGIWFYKAGHGGPVHEGHCFLQVPPHFSRSCVSYIVAIFVSITRIRHLLVTVGRTSSWLYTGYVSVVLLHPPQLCYILSKMLKSLYYAEDCNVRQYFFFCSNLWARHINPKGRCTK